MSRFLAGFKVFCGIFFGITGTLVAIMGTIYLFVTWFGESVGPWVMLIFIIFLAACFFGYLEYRAPWNG